ncbi:MAG: hypothetical protein WBM07_01225 [Chitinivibrionales bacterium]
MTHTTKSLIAFVFILSGIGRNRIVVKQLSPSFVSNSDCTVLENKNTVVSFEEDGLPAGSVPLISNCRSCAGMNGGLC